ncbi:hypothetical protein [Herbidospora sp. NBRC 101105]|uniref:hypothetical protein n=1 Tax=Herbidospora sp. NBRC 101105 TaxID=3032195 RepID=UPI0024A35A9E|nr:hypothetical protein [Herbidospora sp. NBRC 101105]GLX94554.1 hypothetical protein Hesp01_25040 [Herbidospora sp. NBRC 101105]
MHAVALSVLGHGPDAEDAVQDAMLVRVSVEGEPCGEGGAPGTFRLRDLLDVPP